LGVALLKIALELKKPEAKPLEDLIRMVSAQMGLPASEFHTFLASNSGLLQAIASKRGR
jgi:hypothetical protein